MKKITLLILLLPTLCFAGVTVKGVQCSGVMIGYIPRILAVGTSITKGHGDTLLQGDNIGGWLAALSDLITSHNLTGQWGDEKGTNSSELPTLETRDTDETYLLRNDYRIKHFAWSGGNIEMMVDAFSDLNQLDWFIVASEKNIVVVNLGTNEALDEFIGYGDNETDPCTPLPCTEPREADPANIAGYVTYLMSIVDDINSGEAPHPSIFMCLITPMTVDSEAPLYDSQAYLNEWAGLYNEALETAIESKQLSTPNLYYVDLFTTMDGAGWYDGTYSDSNDVLHPNHDGYAEIARILHEKMIEKGLLN